MRDHVVGPTANGPLGGRPSRFTAEAAILGSDFGMKWNQVLEAGGRQVFLDSD